MNGFLKRSLRYMGLCLIIGTSSCSLAQTKYFDDVTITHLPQDAKAHALDVILIDVDGDGDLDLVLALESQPNRLYLNDGKGIFSWKKDTFVPKSHDTEHVRAADFNQDGLLDLIFVAEDDQHHEYYLGNGDGTFTDVSDRLLGKSEANGLDVADVNGDGLMDIVIGNSGQSPQNFLWLNDPKRPGYFLDHSTVSLPQVADQTQSIKLADLDDDGHVDLIIGNEETPNRLLFNDGQGNFIEHAMGLPLNIPLHTREVIVFDANGDGKPDLLFANLTSNGGAKEKDPRARLFINQGNRLFVDETESRMPEQEFSTYAATKVDFDQDGHLDIILSAIKIPPFEEMQVQALRNNGSGHFSFVTDDVIPEITRGRSWGIAVGDVNADGVDDIVIGGWGSQVRLLLGKKQN
ncbi:VCBS repeat-containing protein [Sphingobacterium faecium]|uniref:FG-GAP repeat domain-containing protein n=1 Tax=Sphingobacterium faecium TaxID=34087 RepID=UPI00129289AC|nr:VCBS repeat-containing protein [Sphingobacterium faecium]MQP28788.1 VCBS repeat-containing protein [Sphingobacterium faecium]